MAAFNRIVFLLFAFLVSSTFAVGLTYRGYYTEGGVDGKGGHTEKAAGSIDEAKEKDILDNIHSWSDGKYQAKKPKIAKVLVVSNVNKVKTKGEASDEISDMQKLVNEKTKKDE